MPHLVVARVNDSTAINRRETHRFTRPRLLRSKDFSKHFYSTFATLKSGYAEGTPCNCDQSICQRCCASSPTHLGTPMAGENGILSLRTGQHWRSRGRQFQRHRHGLDTRRCLLLGCCNRLKNRCGRDDLRAACRRRSGAGAATVFQRDLEREIRYLHVE